MTPAVRPLNKNTPRARPWGCLVLAALMVATSFQASAQTWQPLDSTPGTASLSWQKLCTTTPAAGQWAAMTPCQVPVPFTLLSTGPSLQQQFSNPNAFPTTITSVGCTGMCWVNDTATTCIVGSTLAPGASCIVAFVVESQYLYCMTTYGRPVIGNAGGSTYGYTVSKYYPPKTICM